MRVYVCAGLAAVVLLLPDSASGADDTEAPKLVSLQFSPASIKTSTGPAEVTISLTATDDASGVVYIETSFVDPTGTFRQRGSVRFAPTLSATLSIRVTFPRFSNSGVWTLSSVFLSDRAGNTLILDTDGLNEQRFPTRLEVLSSQDTGSPKLTALDFAPARIDTSVGPVDVQVNYTATDDLAGVHYLELSFRSPSGSARRGGSTKLDAAPSVSKALPVTFPRLSEPGWWTLDVVYLADAAGNTLILDNAAISGLGFRSTLEVKSASDTIAPGLTALRVTSEAIDTTQGPATVKVEYIATDNLSGVASFEVVFVSPSDTAKANGAAKFSPAHEVTDAVAVTFPKSSEPGAWRVGSVMLADAAGNTLLLSADEAASKGARPLQVR